MGSILEDDNRIMDDIHTLSSYKKSKSSEIVTHDLIIKGI